MVQQTVHSIKVRSYSSGTQGRAICQARNHHWIADDADYNGGPGEELGAGELFFSGLTACAVNMVERVARQEEIPLVRTDVTVEGIRDTSVSTGGPAVYQEVRLTFELAGPSQAQGEELVDYYKGH
jgi:uncharacterized OsmC-like protein